MIFKDLKQGYSVFVFDKAAVSLARGEVTEVTPPHANLDPKTGMPQFNTFSPDMYVDISVKFSDGTAKTFVLKENTEMGFSGNLVISSSQDNILREVEAFKRQSEQILAQVDKCKENVEKCNAIILEYNPIERDKQKTESRLSGLENSMTDIKGTVSEMKDALTAFLNEFKK